MPDEQHLSAMPFEWQAPPAAALQTRILGWCDEATQQGQAWFKSQRPSMDIHRALDVIAGRDTGYTTTAAYRSRLNPNPLKKNCRQVVGALAKLRPLWGYHSDNKAYTDQAEMMNKVTRAWYLESFADRKIKEALQYAAATGLGWTVPTYRRKLFGQGPGELTILTYGSPCILPVQMPANGDWQSCYVVTILDEMPVAMAHAMWPEKQQVLQPKSARYWYADDNIRRSAMQNFGNIIQRIFGKGTRSAGDPALADLLVPVRRQYIIDLTINRTGKEIPMGDPGSTWFYTVPYVGQQLPDGRKADANDARLYPQRRLIISSDRTVMYDGPAFDWHGMFPGVPFSVDMWPWEPLGYSLVHDGYELNEGIKEVARGMMDKVRAQLRPSMAYDTNAVARKEANDFDPYMPDSRVGFDGTAVEGPPFTPVLPYDMTKLDGEFITFLEYLKSALDAQLGINEVMALARSRAIGSMDELEKIMELMGPIIDDTSRSMEPAMRDLGDMIKYDISQYFTTPRIMQYVGADGVTRQVFDFDPASIVPSHLPGENPDESSPTPKMRRARIFADNLRFLILPNTLHEMQQMVMKLGLVQLRKAGVMIDSQTIAEAWNVPNYGSISGNTVLERWEREQEMQLEHLVKMQMIAKELGIEVPGGGNGAGPPGAAKPGAGKQNPEGRPPTGQAPPRLVSKEGGARSTVAESR
jgi:hypothetical protein